MGINTTEIDNRCSTATVAFKWEQAREECERLGFGERSEWNWKREKLWKCVERGRLELREELARKVTKGDQVGAGARGSGGERVGR